MEPQKKSTSSRAAISAGVFIALYLAVYVIIGIVCMPVPILFLLMPALVALLAAPIFHIMLARSPSGVPIFIAAVLPSLVLIASGHIPIAPAVSVAALHGPPQATPSSPGTCSEASCPSGSCATTSSKTSLSGV